jgi:S1-C subfamily serine protease
MKIYFILFISLFINSVQSQTLPKLITQAKPSVVALAIYNPTAAPRLKLIGSGFVVAPGNLIVTNYHVVSSPLDDSKNERYVVLSGSGNNPVIHPIVSKKHSQVHDLAVLTVESKLPSLPLAQAELAPEGTEVAFIGYPITAVLGLYPATHRAIISSITPIMIPSDHSQVLDARMLKQLRDPFMIYQLDGTAYPGNSGSAVLDQQTGAVVGVINMVFVKASREAVLSDPSGISYAIPVKHLHQLLAQ